MIFGFEGHAVNGLDATAAQPLQLSPDHLEDRAWVRELPGFLLGINLFTVDAHLKHAPASRN